MSKNTENQQLAEKIKSMNCFYEETKYAICYYHNDGKVEKVFTYQSFYDGDAQSGYSNSGYSMQEGFNIGRIKGYKTQDEAEAQIKKFVTNKNNKRFDDVPLMIDRGLNSLLSVNGNKITESWSTPSNAHTYEFMDQVKDYPEVQKKVIEGLFAFPFKVSVTPA